MKKLFAVVLVIMFILLIASAVAETNVRVAIIVDIDEEADEAICEDACGLTWEFFEVEDFCVGDVVVLTMWDAETTDTIFDDEIIDVIYSGFVAADVH